MMPPITIIDNRTRASSSEVEQQVMALLTPLLTEVRSEGGDEGIDFVIVVQRYSGEATVHRYEGGCLPREADGARKRWSNRKVRAWAVGLPVTNPEPDPRPHPHLDFPY